MPVFARSTSGTKTKVRPVDFSYLQSFFAVFKELINQPISKEDISIIAICLLHFYHFCISLLRIIHSRKYSCISLLLIFLFSFRIFFASMPDLLHPPGCKFIAINSDKSFYSIFRNSHASVISSSIGMEFSTEFTEQQSFIQQFSKFFHFCSSIIIYYFCPTYFYLNVGDRNFEKRLFLKKFSFKL